MNNPGKSEVTEIKAILESGDLIPELSHLINIILKKNEEENNAGKIQQRKRISFLSNMKDSGVLDPAAENLVYGIVDSDEYSFRLQDEANNILVSLICKEMPDLSNLAELVDLLKDAYVQNNADYYINLRKALWKLDRIPKRNRIVKSFPIESVVLCLIYILGNEYDFESLGVAIDLVFKIGKEAKTAVPYLKNLVHVDACFEDELDIAYDHPRILLVGSHAIRALVKIGCPSVIPALIPILDHEDVDLRGNAAWALGIFGPQATLALKPLKKLFDDHEPTTSKETYDGHSGKPDRAEICDIAITARDRILEKTPIIIEWIPYEW